MSTTRQTHVSGPIPKLAVFVLAVIFAAGMFIVGFDQGHMFSLVFSVW